MTSSFPKVDSLEATLTCPQCKAQNRITLAQIKREETIKCTECGAEIQLTDKDKRVQKETENIQHSLDELEKTLRKFGR